MEPHIFGQVPPVAGPFYAARGKPDVHNSDKQEYHVVLPETARVDAVQPPARYAVLGVTNRDLNSNLQFAADTVLIVMLSILTGAGYHQIWMNMTGPVRDFAYTGLTVALLFAGIDRLLVTRHGPMLTTAFDRLRSAAQVWSLAFAALVFCLFTLKAGSHLSRGAVLSFYLVGLPLVGLWRVMSPPALARFAHQTGRATRKCIVVGDNEDPALDGFVAELNESGRPAPHVIKFQGRCDHRAWAAEQKNLVGRVLNAARTSRHGEIYVCSGAIAADRLAAIQRALNILPCAIFVVPDVTTAALIRCKPSSVGAFIAIEVRREPLGPMQRAVKRTMDIVLAALAMVCLSPFFALIALAVKRDSPGPAFFRQTRIGYRGRPFKIVKFRTMHVQEDGPEIRQASRDDARVTRVGRFLRKTSIDELPQLFNILLGDMSLVGPRPHALAHDELYGRSIENYEVRQHVKPGLTGWAQVHGLRGETATLDLMYRRIEFDLWYAVNASLVLDCEILIRTVYEVFRQRNAY